MIDGLFSTNLRVYAIFHCTFPSLPSVIWIYLFFSTHKTRKFKIYYLSKKFFAFLFPTASNFISSLNCKLFPTSIKFMMAWKFHSLPVPLKVLRLHLKVFQSDASATIHSFEDLLLISSHVRDEFSSLSKNVSLSRESERSFLKSWGKIEREKRKNIFIHKSVNRKTFNCLDAFPSRRTKI